MCNHALRSVHAVFGLTACLYWFFSARLMDRVSKGVREAPSKAIINELARESGDSPDAAYGAADLLLAVVLPLLLMSTADSCGVQWMTLALPHTHTHART
jgi:hypothetical protein